MCKIYVDSNALSVCPKKSQTNLSKNVFLTRVADKKYLIPPIFNNMGGSQSTRKVTVDNENAIQMSQDALDRITAQLNSKAAEPQPQQSYTSPPPPPFYDSRRQQENAAEEAYWARRIEALKRAHEKINSGMHIEYQKTLKEANDLFNLAQQDKIASKLPPCQDEKSKVLECYSSNPDKSLLCSVLVNQFNDCVCKSRIAAVTSS